MRKFFILVLVLLFVATTVNSYFVWTYMSKEGGKERITPALLKLGFREIEITGSKDEMLISKRSKMPGTTYYVTAGKDCAVIALEVFWSKQGHGVVVWDAATQKRLL